MGAAAGGDVEGGVAVEEPDGLEGEAGGLDRHDRPVLGAGEVGGAEGVPDDDVLAVDRPVGRVQVGRPAPPGFWLTKSPAG